MAPRNSERMRRLRGALRPFRGRSRLQVDLRPDTPFDALLEERIRNLEQRVDELKSRINGLLFLVVGAVLAQVVLDLVG